MHALVGAEGEALGEFDFDAAVGDVVGAFEADVVGEKAVAVQLRAGDIDGNRQQGKTGVRPAAQQLADRFEDVGVELADESVALEQRDEFGGRNQPLLRVIPAHERFGGGDPALAEIVFRLQIDDKFAVRQCVFHAVLERLVGDHGLTQLVCVDDARQGGVLFRVMVREVGAVDHLLDGNAEIAAFVAVDADVDVQCTGVGNDGGDIADGFGQGAAVAQDVLPVLVVDYGEEGIAVYAAVGFVLFAFAEAAGVVLQNFITRGEAVDIVDVFKIADVRVDDGVVRERVLLQELLDVQLALEKIVRASDGIQIGDFQKLLVVGAHIAREQPGNEGGAEQDERRNGQCVEDDALFVLLQDVARQDEKHVPAGVADRRVAEHELFSAQLREQKARAAVLQGNAHRGEGAVAFFAPEPFGERVAVWRILRRQQEIAL